MNINHKIKRRIFYFIHPETLLRKTEEKFGAYLNRILFRRGRRFPSGGVQIIYRHCEILRKNGYEAYLVATGRLEADWFPHNIEPVNFKKTLRLIEPEDMLVVPERIALASLYLPPARKYVFVQNLSLIGTCPSTLDSIINYPFRSRPSFVRRTGIKYENFGSEGIMTCGQFLHDRVRNISSLPCYKITNGIDLDFFSPCSKIRIPGRILYFSRKDSLGHATNALSILSKMDIELPEIVKISSGITQGQMLVEYHKSDIFIANTFPEGFGLQALEAMACGCAVAGFAGGGGTEFMKNRKTALIVGDGDEEALANSIAELLKNPGLKENIRAGGIEMAKSYGFSRMEAELMKFMNEIF